MPETGELGAVPKQKQTRRHKKKQKTVEKKGPKNDPKKAGQKMLPRGGFGGFSELIFLIRGGWLKRKRGLFIKKYLFIVVIVVMPLCLIVVMPFMLFMLINWL